MARERPQGDQPVAAPDAGGERQQGGAGRGVRLGDLDAHVDEQEAERADGGRPVHGLGEQPAARAEDQPVGGDEPPDDGRGQRDQGEHATGLVEEAVEVHAPAR